MNTYESYVSLETAKMLKQVGFDWEGTSYYQHGVFYPYSIDGDRLVILNQNSAPDYMEQYNAPTLDVAQGWLREMKSIEVVPWRWPTKVGFVDGYKPWSYKIVIYKNLEEVDIDDFNASGEDYFKTYEEAQEAGINKALEIILKK